MGTSSSCETVAELTALDTAACSSGTGNSTYREYTLVSAVVAEEREFESDPRRICYGTTDDDYFAWTGLPLSQAAVCVRVGAGSGVEAIQVGGTEPEPKTESQPDSGNGTRRVK